MYRLPSLSLAFLLVAAAALVGCDSGTTGGVSGPSSPTLSFASSTVAAPELDSTITFEVQLLNATSEVTAEIIYASDASTAGPEDLGFSTDGLPAIGSAFVYETITLVPDDDGTASQSFTFSILDDVSGEARESAFFALQNVSSAEEVTLGTRQVEVAIGFRPIDEIREFDDGRVVAANGIVTRYDGDNVYFQDDTGGIVAFNFGDVVPGPTSIGDEIVVTGPLGAFNGLRQIGPGDIALSIISEGNDLPDPQEVTVNDVTSNGEAYEGRLVRITGLSTSAEGTFSGGTTYTASDDTGTINFRVQSGSPFAGQSVPSEPFTFEGVVGQFNDYQLLPLRDGDLIEE